MDTKKRDKSWAILGVGAILLESVMFFSKPPGTQIPKVSSLAMLASHISLSF